MGGAPQTRVSVLVVEPVAPLRQHLIDLIRQDEDLEDSGATSVGQAVQMVRAIKPDVALVGASLTGRAGFDAVEKLRTIDSKLKILVLSAQPAASSANRMLLAGADGFATLDDLELITDAIRDVVSFPIFLSDSVFSHTGGACSEASEPSIHTPGKALSTESVSSRKPLPLAMAGVH